jgi:predicted GIY-YIG superfamily endonuclease
VLAVFDVGSHRDILQGGRTARIQLVRRRIERVLLRDRLRAQLDAMADAPDYVRLAAEVLGIRNAPSALARRLVEQALVLEDRRDAWVRTGERICAAAPTTPGVYLLRDAEGRALYVGKANNVRRRLRTHFAVRRWKTLKPAFTRAVAAEWHDVGSEIEALLLEAVWIRAYQPTANVQVAAPALDTRAIPASLRRNTLLVLPSSDPVCVALLAVRASGAVMLERVRRDGVGLSPRAADLWRFLRASEPSSATPAEWSALAPLVLSWLAGRGSNATRLDPGDIASAREFRRRLKLLLDDERLFAERIVVIRSGFRPTSSRP